jgi:hypothetical protein
MFWPLYWPSIRLYSTSQSNYTIYVHIGRQDLIYNIYRHELNLIDSLEYLISIYYILTRQRALPVHKVCYNRVVASECCVMEG